MTEPKDCPFCKLHQQALRENELAYVLLSDPRKVPGHFLVIPKRHVEKPWELSNEEVSAIFALLRPLQRKITETLAEGCDVRQNYRPFVKQGRLKVDHVHYHVLPRDSQDALSEKAGGHESALFKDLSPEEYARIARILEE